MAGRTITAAEIRDVVIKSAIAAQHKVELAVVRSFTAATATAGPLAEVELSTKFRRMVDYVSETYNGPVLGNVPVLYSRLTFPLIAGDEVLVVCADRGVDTAYENGGTNNEPDGDRRNSLTDAFCIPFAWSKATSAALTHTAATVVLDQGAQTAVHVGRDATKAAARVDDYVDRTPAFELWMGFVNTAILALIAGTPAVAPGVGSPRIGLVSTGSLKVKIE